MRFLDGRSCVAETQQVPMYPDRPEAARVEPKWLNRAAVQKRLKLSDEEVELAIALSDPVRFPLASKHTSTGSFSVVLLWRDTDLDKWEARVREHYDLLGRLIRLKK